MLIYRHKGMSITVELILVIGALMASAFFFIAFYNLAMYQSENVFSASEKGFLEDIGYKINIVSLSLHDMVEYSYNPPVNTYSLKIRSRRMIIEYPKRASVSAIVPVDIADADIADSRDICIQKSGSKILLLAGRCPKICDALDDICDSGCVLFGVCDPKCGKCSM